jgi:hypothetical protein
MSASIYLAASSADDTVADVLQVYLEHAGIACVRRADVQVLMDYAEDLRMTMKDCTAIIVLDSFSFRDVPDNWELHFAQVLQKPLVVVSLDTPLNEGHSTDIVKLINFTTPQERDWHRLLNIIQQLVYVSAH